MQIKKYKVGTLKNDLYNPRIIDTYKYQTLVRSLQEFPDMLNVRPLIIDTDHNILCGNMRYRAAIELGYDSVPARMVDLDDDKKKELIIKDNISYGDWDDAQIKTNFNSDLFDKWMGYERFDYAELNYEDLDGVLDNMTKSVKRAIKVDFGDNVERAKEVIAEARKHKVYVGGFFLEVLKSLSHENIGVSQG